MRRLCPPRVIALLAVAIVAVSAIACGELGSSSEPTATPTRAQGLGIEIAKTYGEMFERARVVVEPRPATPEAKELLRLLGEEYKVRFGTYACIRDELSDAEQADVAASFDANREAFLPADMAWFEDAASDYDLEDPDIRVRMEALRTLDVYAFVERHTASQPGEELLCR